jgi:hypothetical protein
LHPGIQTLYFVLWVASKSIETLRGEPSIPDLKTDDVRFVENGLSHERIHKKLVGITAQIMRQQLE